jgi:hypothetical protein
MLDEAADSESPSRQDLYRRLAADAERVALAAAAVAQAEQLKRIADYLDGILACQLGVGAEWATHGIEPDPQDFATSDSWEEYQAARKHTQEQMAGYRKGLGLAPQGDER